MPDFKAVFKDPSAPPIRHPKRQDASMLGAPSRREDETDDTFHALDAIKNGPALALRFARRAQSSMRTEKM